MTLHTVLFVLCSLFFQTDSIEGTWITQDDETGKQKSEVLIYIESGKLYGKITKLLLPEDEGKICVNCKGENKDKPIPTAPLITAPKKTATNIITIKSIS